MTVNESVDIKVDIIGYIVYFIAFTLLVWAIRKRASKMLRFGFGDRV